jgi:hypothetical protein
LKSYIVRLVGTNTGPEDEETRKWIEEKSASSPGLARYLKAWGDWKSPYA